jgi:threonine/homoserine/homoserine lactone efflux protein
MDMGSFFFIFGLSFLTALTGALSPGPLLTYTIMQSLKDKKSGHLMGFKIIAGHAILESVILIAIMLGFSAFLSNALFRRAISLAGCAFLVISGISIFIAAKKGRISADFINPGETEPKSPAERTKLPHPVLGGIVVSMSNPYWWIWWATIGSTFLVTYNISISSWDRMLVFFIGYEAGDLIWYVPVSFLTHLGRRIISTSVYIKVIVACGIFMVGFGLFLGIYPFF